MPAAGRTVDPLDAVLAGDDRPEFADVSAVVEDLVATYVPDEPLRRSAALAAFTDPTPATPEPARGSGRRRVGATLTALLATFGGKVVLGGAVAAAAVGGLHVTERIDVPLIPDVGHADEAPGSDIEVVDPSDGPVRRDAARVPRTSSLDLAELRASDRSPSDGIDVPPPDVAGAGEDARSQDVVGPDQTSQPDRDDQSTDTDRQQDTGQQQDTDRQQDSERTDEDARPEDPGQPEGAGAPEDLEAPAPRNEPEGAARPADAGQPEGIEAPSDVGSPGERTPSGRP